ncbi:MAG: hypothetical protein JXR73_21445 [Candidatus Omnitrophica bacterium]|nr:hypothetical protein [Candidatus Omnitrophota bacterium]
MAASPRAHLDAMKIASIAELSQASRRRLSGGGIVNLDVHTLPRFGEKSVLEDIWASARGKVVKIGG